MTRGNIGVQKTLFEVNRVLKPASYFCFAEMLSDGMETKAQKIDFALFSYICRRGKGLSGKEYEAMLEKANFKLVEEKDYHSGLKFTPKQAKREVKYVVESFPKTYGIATPSFNDAWTTFGKTIEENGMGCYSKITLITTQKVQDIS